MYQRNNDNKRVAYPLRNQLIKKNYIDDSSTAEGKMKEVSCMFPALTFLNPEEGGKTLRNLRFQESDVSINLFYSEFYFSLFLGCAPSIIYSSLKFYYSVSPKENSYKLNKNITNSPPLLDVFFGCSDSTWSTLLFTRSLAYKSQYSPVDALDDKLKGSEVNKGSGISLAIITGGSLFIREI